MTRQLTAAIERALAVPACPLISGRVIADSAVGAAMRQCAGAPARSRHFQECSE
jgi:hypothetical protein